jgi:DNA polymerase III sliding clamp (beta) subunit (PCNA family)
MQVTLCRDDLALMVKGFNKVVPKGSRPPVFRHVHIQAVDESGVAVTVTDTEETLVYRVQNAVEVTEGAQAFLFPYGDLKRFASELKKQHHLVLTSTDGAAVSATIVSGDQSTTVELTVPAVQAFPEQLKPVPLRAGNVSAFLAAYSRAIPFAAVGEMRHVLNGVFYHHQVQSVVATDAHRLFRGPVAESPLQADVIIPVTKVLKSDLLDYGQGTGGVLTDGGVPYIEIASGPWRYQLKCIDGLYVNYQQVIPATDATFPAELAFASDDLDSIGQAFRDVTDREHGYLSIYGDGNVVLLISQERGDDRQRNHVDLPFVAARFERPLVVEVNATYFLDVLGAGMAAVRLPDDRSPLLFTDKSGAVCVLMPSEVEDHAEVTRYVQEEILGEEQQEETVDTENTTTPDQANAPADSSPKSDQPATQDGSSTIDVPEVSPLDDLTDCIKVTQEQLRDASTVVRELKKKVRAVVRMYKVREKQQEATMSVLEKLKEAASF